MKHWMAGAALVIAALLWMTPAEAAPVTVCNLPGTAHPEYCVIVNSDGSITTSGGGGGAVTIADGADVTQGAKADTVCATDTGTCTLIALIKKLTTNLTTATITTGTAGSASAQVLSVQGIAAMTPILATPAPATAGGLSVYFVQPTASDNHVVIKAGAGQIYKLTVTNNSATVNYIRFYNATTGFNGCNSATNLVYQAAIPASTSVGGLSDSWDLGMAFATGISICVTSGYATTDTTNATASAMSVNVGYK